ncbi:hypothetical protein V6N11_035601 [Hibiscus sabdariffa]|uniref:Uncharacterized protein n=1 Tax=Hibiscus sabdariffa TaxID=183260 RepID=A0ABR2N6Z6_9ROSI
MVDERGEWNWSRLWGLLPMETLERLAACPPPRSHYGDDVPGWRWDDNRKFTVSSVYEYLRGGEASNRHHKWRLIWSLKAVKVESRGIRSSWLTFKPLGK